MGKINFDELSASLANNIRNKADNSALQTLTTNLEGIKNKVDEHILNHPGLDISVVDNLSTTDSLNALSANQGKILNDKYTSLNNSNNQLTGSISQLNSSIGQINGSISQLNTKIQENTSSVSNKADTSTVSTLSNKVNGIETNQGQLSILKTNDKSSIVSAINEVFTNVSNGKSLLASAISDKGVPTLATDSFETMKNNIISIETSGGGVSTPEIQTQYITSSAQNVKVTHTLKSKTKNLSIKSQSICGVPDAEGNYVLRYSVGNGVISSDPRYKQYYKQIKTPYPLYGTDYKQNELKQKEDGSFEFIRRCEISGEINKWNNIFLPKENQGLCTVTVNDKIYCIGGYTGNATLNTLNIYDITTNTWSVGAPIPTARYTFSAQVYNGKIYCIGGRLLSGTSTVEIYDIGTDTWSVGSPIPENRYEFTSELYNGKIYCLGGYYSGYAINVYIYDIETDTWVLDSKMANYRYGLCSSMYGDNIYCIGGNNGSYVSIVNCYNITNRTWTTLQPMNTAMGRITCQIYGDKIYCIGGYDGQYKYISLLEYNITTNTWATKYTPTEGKYYCSSAIYNNYIYCIGGGHGSTISSNYIEIYNADTELWITGCNLSSGRTGMTSQLYNNRIYCIGGYNGSILSSMHLYNIQKNKWFTGYSTMPTARYLLSSALYDGKIYCIGGIINSTTSTSILEIYDIETDTWSAGANAPVNIESHYSFLYNGKIYCIGGYLSSFLIYNIGSNSWEYGETIPIARKGISCEFYDNKLYCIGGVDSLHYYNTLYIYDIINNTWTQGKTIPSFLYYGNCKIYNNKIYHVGGYDANGSKDDLYVYDIATDTWISEKMLIARKNATIHIQDNRLYCIGGEKSSSSYISNTHVYELANIQQSFQEVIIPITEDNSFDTFAHVTEINSLDTSSPILKADFLVEI